MQPAVLLLHAGGRNCQVAPWRPAQLRGHVPGALGIITPISGHFCDSCNRIRVTASGMVRGCLFAPGGTDLKPLLQSKDGGLLRETLGQMVRGKPGRHRLAEGESEQVAMSRVGG